MSTKKGRRFIFFSFKKTMLKNSIPPENISFYELQRLTSFNVSSLLLVKSHKQSLMQSMQAIVASMELMCMKMNMRWAQA